MSVISSVQVTSSERTSDRSASTTSAKSCPAEKTGPLPARTMPSAWLSPISWNAVMSSCMCARDKALRRCGRFMVTVAKSPDRSTRMCSKPMTASSYFRSLRWRGSAATSPRAGRRAGAGGHQGHAPGRGPGPAATKAVRRAAAGTGGHQPWRPGAWLRYLGGEDVKGGRLRGHARCVERPGPAGAERRAPPVVRPYRQRVPAHVALVRGASHAVVQQLQARDEDALEHRRVPAAMERAARLAQDSSRAE